MIFFKFIIHGFFFTCPNIFYIFFDKILFISFSLNSEILLENSKVNLILI